MPIVKVDESHRAMGSAVDGASSINKAGEFISLLCSQPSHGALKFINGPWGELGRLCVRAFDPEQVADALRGTFRPDSTELRCSLAQHIDMLIRLVDSDEVTPTVRASLSRELLAHVSAIGRLAVSYHKMDVLDSGETAADSADRAFLKKIISGGPDENERD